MFFFHKHACAFNRLPPSLSPPFLPLSPSLPPSLSSLSVSLSPLFFYLSLSNSPSLPRSLSLSLSLSLFEQLRSIYRLLPFSKLVLWSSFGVPSSCFFIGSYSLLRFMVTWFPKKNIILQEYTVVGARGIGWCRGSSSVVNYK